MPELKTQNQSKCRTCEIFLFCFCIAYIALFCWLGTYARPQVDDYDWYFRSEQEWFMPFQLDWYLHQDGRVMRTALMTLLCVFPPDVVYSFLPLSMLLIYAGATVFLVKTLAPELSHHAKWLSVLLLTSIMLACLTSLNETLYWLNGLMYFWAPIFLMVSLGLAVSSLRDGSGFAFWLCVALLFVNGTVIEPACVFQGVVAFLAALYFLRRGDRKRAIICAAFWLVSVIAFLIMYLAPGTASRMGGYSSVSLTSRLGRMMAVAVVFGGVTVLKFFVKPLVWLLFLFLPSIHTLLSENRALLRLKSWQIFLITILIAPLTHGISGWAGGEGLPLRAESLTIWMMGFTWMMLWIFCYDASGWNARLKTKKIFSVRWALLIAALILNFNCVTAIKDLANGSAARYAAECDVRDARTEAADSDVAVALLTEHPALLLYSDLRPWLHTG